MPVDRSCRVSGEDLTVYGDIDNCSLGVKDLGWRRTCNHTEKEPTVSLSKTINTSRREFVSSQSSNLISKNAAGNHLKVSHNTSESFALPESNTTAERPFSQLDPSITRKRNTEKRKYGSTSNYCGESSRSNFEVSDVSFPGTSSRPSKSRSTRTRNSQRSGIVLGPIIELDELSSPEATSSNRQKRNCSTYTSSDSLVRQIESDEILAQQLQEQFYIESGGPVNSDVILTSTPFYLKLFFCGTTLTELERVL